MLRTALAPATDGPPGAVPYPTHLKDLTDPVLAVTLTRRVLMPMISTLPLRVQAAKPLHDLGVPPAEGWGSKRPQVAERSGGTSRPKAGGASGAAGRRVWATTRLCCPARSSSAARHRAFAPFPAPPNAPTAPEGARGTARSADLRGALDGSPVLSGSVVAPVENDQGPHP
ncbi:hypothetical protein GCM10022227_43140 [Streptomyces sedi]